MRVLAASGAAGAARIHGSGSCVRSGRALSTGLAFYALLPFRVARELRDFRPDAVLAQGAQEAALCVARSHARARADEGRSRTSTATRRHRRGSTARHGARRSRPSRTRLPAVGFVGATACGRSPPTRPRSSVRPVSSRRRSSPRSWTSSRSSTSDPAPFPERPVALFVGVLERYKAVDVLAEAWRLAAPRVPEAALHLVGRGTLREVSEQPRRRPPGADALDGVAPDVRGRPSARRGDRARPPVEVGGSRPRRRRGVLPRPRRRRQPCRRDSRHRRGRRDRAPRSARRRDRRSRTRSFACSRRSAARGAARRGGPRCRAAVARDARGVRAAHPRARRRRTRDSPPTLNRCGRTGRSSS